MSNSQLEGMINDSVAHTKPERLTRKHNSHMYKRDAPLTTKQLTLKRNATHPEKVPYSPRVNTLKPITTFQAAYDAIVKIYQGLHTRQNYASTNGVVGARLELAESFQKHGVACEPAVLARMPINRVREYKRDPFTYQA